MKSAHISITTYHRSFMQEPTLALFLYVSIFLVQMIIQVNSLSNLTVQQWFIVVLMCNKCISEST